MKRLVMLLVVITMLLVACAGETPAPQAILRTVTDGSSEKDYSVDDLKGLAISQADFGEESYEGVSLQALLQDAGFDPAGVSVVKATAADGFTANYEPELVTKHDTLVAFARVDGPLSADDGIFRMVLPGQEGKLNVRQLIELRIFQ